MRKGLIPSLVAMLVIALAVPGVAQEPKTDEQKALYALGVVISQNLSSFKLSETELEMVKAGLTDGVLHKTLKADPQASRPKLEEMQRIRLAAAAESEKKLGKEYLDKAKHEHGATQTASGLVIFTLKPGTGASPAASDKVKVNYHGTLIDGTVFDSSVQRGQPVTFPLNGVIRCWTEGVQLMKVGGKSRLVCPAELAYGDRGAPPRINPGATLVFEIELLEIVK